MVEAAGVEPVPAHFLTGDGAHFLGFPPSIRCHDPVLSPLESPAVPWSPPQSWRHLGDGSASMGDMSAYPTLSSGHPIPASFPEVLAPDTLGPLPSGCGRWRDHPFASSPLPGRRIKLGLAFPG